MYMLSRSHNDKCCVTKVIWLFGARIDFINLPFDTWRSEYAIMFFSRTTTGRISLQTFRTPLSESTVLRVTKQTVIPQPPSRDAIWRASGEAKIEVTIRANATHPPPRSWYNRHGPYHLTGCPRHLIMRRRIQAFINARTAGSGWASTMWSTEKYLPEATE